MAAVTLLGTATFNTTNGTKTVTATPAVGDLIVIIDAHTGNTAGVAPTDNQSGTYTSIAGNALKASSADMMRVYVRNSLIPSAVSTVFTVAPGTTTGGGMVVLKVTGMTNVGSSAVRSTGSGVQQATLSNQAAGTPAPAFPAAPLTTNPQIGAVFNGTNPATMTPTTGWGERADVGYNTPTTGLHVQSVDSGQTAQTVTWGSASGSGLSAIIVELDASVPPPPPKSIPMTMQFLSQ